MANLLAFSLHKRLIPLTKIWVFWLDLLFLGKVESHFFVGKKSDLVLAPKCLKRLQKLSKNAQIGKKTHF